MRTSSFRLRDDVGEEISFHITTCTNDSRTSQRMIKYKVRQRRDGGKRPKPEPILLEIEDELLIMRIISEIIDKDELNIPAYNICRDHLHLLLVCRRNLVPKIVGKIKAMTARAYNLSKGIYPRGHVPLGKYTPTMGTKISLSGNYEREILLEYHGVY